MIQTKPIHLYPNIVQDIDFLATRLKNNLILFILVFFLIFLISCARISSQNLQNNDAALQKCIDSFMKGNGTVTNKSSPYYGQDMPEFLKKEIAKATCQQLLNSSKQQLEGYQQILEGVFVNQGIILSKDGGSFDITVKTGPATEGNFNINIIAGAIPTGNSLNLEFEQDQFYLSKNSQRIISVKAKPVIKQGYNPLQEAFPIKITASKDGKLFREVNIIILAATK